MANRIGSEGPAQPVPLRQVLPSGAILLSGPSLRVRIAVLRPGFLLITTVGSATEPRDRDVELAMLREFEIEIERAAMLTTFLDLRETSRMNGDSREMVATWMRKHKPQLNPGHILLRSKLMEMAISILGMLTGGGMINTYSKPQAFLDVVRAVAPRITALPTIDR